MQTAFSKDASGRAEARTQPGATRPRQTAVRSGLIGSGSAHPVAEILRPWQPALAYHLLELVRIPFLELGGTPEGILTLRMLKAQPLGQLFTDVIWDEKLLFSISDSVFERMMRYVLSQEGTPEQLRARIAHFHNKPLKDKTMTIAEQLKQEGRQEGREEGLRLAILRALEIHFGPVPQKIPDALEGITDLGRLEKLLESALRSHSIEEFFESI